MAGHQHLSTEAQVSTPMGTLRKGNASNIGKQKYFHSVAVPFFMLGILQPFESIRILI